MKTKTDKHTKIIIEKFLSLRNIAVILTAILFTVSVIPYAPLVEERCVLRSIAYVVGAVAYFSESLYMTKGLKVHLPNKEMLMSRVMFIVYLMLAVEYMVEAFA